MTIGVDVGSKNIKICKIHTADGYSTLACAIMSEHAAETVTAAEAEVMISHKIHSMVKTLPLTSQSAVVSVGVPEMVTHNFIFPPMSPEELRGAVKIESVQAVSADLGSMSVDHQVLSEVENNQNEVLFVAVPNPVINRLLRISSRGGLDVETVDLDNLAIANCFTALEHDVEKQSAVILNIGYVNTNIVVIDGGKVRFVRNVGFGGAHITEAIATRYNIAMDVAEEIKKQSFLWNSMGLNIKNILRQCMPDLLEAVYRSIEYCMNRKRLLSVDRILLTGGSSNLTGMDRFVSEVFGIDTERWNPLDYLDVGETGRKEYGQFLCVALGLALRAHSHA
jgi:type IV pilus assembly protein PilM